jgi:maltose O-acetyltransferase
MSLATPTRTTTIQDHALTAGTSYRSVRAVGMQSLKYATSHVINRIPSHAVRGLWYRRVLGLAIGRGAVIHLGVDLWLLSRGQVRRGAIDAAGQPRVSIGANTWINRGCTLDLRGGLRIGDNVSIAAEVVILSADHDRDQVSFPLRFREVVIEDHVWIGMRAMILPGVHIGRGAVVGAGSVVTRDVAALAVVAGAPARQIGTRSVGAVDYTFDAPRPLFE